MAYKPVDCKAGLEGGAEWEVDLGPLKPLTLLRHLMGSQAQRPSWNQRDAEHERGAV